MTNGSKIEINSTGTQLRFHPGVLLGGEVTHACPVEKSMGWFLEGILPLAAFGKEDLCLRLEGGVTDGLHHEDPSVDYVATSLLPLLKRFGIGNSEGGESSLSSGDRCPLSVKVVRRGAAPLGGGEVVFTCPIVKEIGEPLEMVDVGKIKRVRGTVVSCKIPPSSAARVAHSAKGLLHRLLPDVWIHTDVHSSRKGSSNKKNDMRMVDGGGSGGGGGVCGPSPGLSVCLAAESTSGTVLVAETCLDASREGRGALLPEDLGVKAAAMLLEEIRKGGCIDTGAQSLALLLMCLGPEDVSRIRVGTLSQYTIVSLRLFKKAFDVEFKVRADEESKTVLLSCLGTGYRNMARAST